MIRGSFLRIGPTSFGGYAVDDDDPARALAVELLVDGMPVDVTLADQYSAALAGSDDPYHGFALALPQDALAGGAVIEARLANLGQRLGGPIHLGALPAAEPLSFGAVQWLGGVRFAGWLTGERDGRLVRVHINGELVSEVPATGWRHIGTSRDDRRVARSFTFHVPPSFADGRVRRLVVTDEGGSRLEGCPIAFLAFADGLADALDELGEIASERPRGALFDRLFPSSVPMPEYEAWRARFPLPHAAPTERRVAVITGGHGASETALDADHVRAQLGREKPDMAVFCLEGTQLYDGALERFASAFANETTKLVYSDFDLPDRAGRPHLMALPAFDRERLLEQGYAARLFALRRDALERALAARPQSLYGVCLSAVAACNEPTAIAHLPGALALLPPIDVAAATADLVAAIKSAPVTHGSSEVQPAAGAIFPAARIRRPVSMRVTLVALARYDDAELDQRIATLEPALARVGGEVLVRRPDRPGESLARLANTALAQVTSEAVCFIGEGVSAEDDTWLEEMLGRLAGPDVGAVGPVLLDSAGRVREAGLVLGPRFDAVPAFADHASDEAGYADALAVARECSAIGGACFLASKAQLAAVAGFDAQRFPEHYPFVDLCLRLRARGARIIVTPHARLVQARAAPAAEPPSRERERSRLRGLWGEVIAADPTYSPLLNRDAEPFTALAWPPRGFELRHSHGEQPLTSPLLSIL